MFERLGKDSPDKKKTVLQVFNNYVWFLLTTRKSHSFLDCQGCLRDFKETLSYFPVKKGDWCAKKKAVVFNKQQDLNKNISINDKEKIMRLSKKNIEEQWKETSVLRLLKIQVVYMSIRISHYNCRYYNIYNNT